MISWPIFMKECCRTGGSNLLNTSRMSIWPRFQVRQFAICVQILQIIHVLILYSSSAIHTPFRRILTKWQAKSLAQTIRICLGCEVRIEKSIRGSMFGITIFLSAPNNHERFFFLHTFWSPAFDFNVGVAINESCSYTLTSTILKTDVVCDVAMTSTRNVITTESCDFLYNQCIDMLVLVFLSIPRVG